MMDLIGIVSMLPPHDLIEYNHGVRYVNTPVFLENLLLRFKYLKVVVK